MVLAPRRRPYRGEFPEARREREVAQDAEDEAIQKRDGAAGGQHEADRPGQCYPRTIY